MVRRAPAFLAAILGLAWFLAVGGGPALDTGRIGWILRPGDPAVHWLGWAFFRNEPWRLPLGSLTGYLHPVGTSIGFLDAIPLVAILLKPLSPLLAPDFQYLGWWLAACFALQGLMGARIAAAFTDRPWDRVLGAALFVTSPVLLRRVGHESLCAQWLVLWVMGMAFRPPGAGTTRGLLAALAAACLLAAAIHPFLCAMVVALAAGVVLQRCLWDRELGLGSGLAFLGAVAAGVMAVLALLGFLGGAPAAARGFGYFSADLLTLVNPMGWSRVLPSFGTRPGQYEGFGYLGAGVLALGLAALCLAWTGGRAARGARLGRLVPLAAVAGVLALLAVSSYVTFAGRKLFGTSALPPGLARAVGAFRSSGRLIWPLHYFLVAGAIGAVVGLLRQRPRAATLSLAAAVAIQVADLGTDRVLDHFRGGPAVPGLEGWERAGGSFRHLSIVPPRVVDGDGRGCAGALPFERELRLAYRAYRLDWTFNSGSAARLDLAAVERSCREARDDLEHGRLSPDTIYVVLPEVQAAMPPGSAVCGRLDGETACVSPLGRSAFRDHLERAAGP